jgi:hypothetical protein
MSKRQGIYTGRKPTFDRERVKELAKGGIGRLRNDGVVFAPSGSAFFSRMAGKLALPTAHRLMTLPDHGRPAMSLQ